jgi:hypothetical protein
MSQSSKRKPSPTTSKSRSGSKKLKGKVAPSKSALSVVTPTAKRNIRDAYRYEVEFNVIITKSTDLLMDYERRMTLPVDAYGRHRVETVDRVVDYDLQSIFTTALAQVAERTVTGNSLVGQYPTKEVNLSLDAATTALILQLMGLVSDPPEEPNDEAVKPQEAATEDDEEAAKSLVQKLKGNGPEVDARRKRGRPAKSK